MLFVGDDWAEDHHDIEIVDEQGRRLVRRRLAGGGGRAGGAARADRRPSRRRRPSPAEVVVGIETDRGPWVQALIAAGYTVYAINPLQAARYRERHGVVRAPRATPATRTCWPSWSAWTAAITGRSPATATIAEHVKVLARTHQSMIWSRQRQTNTLRSMLREFYPAALAAFGDDLAGRDALAVLAVAPDPGCRAAGSRMARVVDGAAAGRAATQPRAPPPNGSWPRCAPSSWTPARAWSRAYAASVTALVAVIAELARQVEVLEGEVEAGFGRHPDAEIYLSQPGLGTVLGARVLAEFGDDPTRYADARARKNYSGMAPITRASGHQSRVVLARHARNRRLADALYQQAFAALSASPGARAFL